MRPSFATLACALLVTGCATTRVGSPPGSRPADPEQLTQWMAKGRIALAARGEGGSGSFVWQQRSERTELTLRGPLGAGGLALVTDGTTFELSDGAGQPLNGEAAKTELERRLGVKLPLAELRYWMLGAPAPVRAGGGPVQTSSGSVPGFVQGGWVVSYEELTSQAGWSLPARLTATTNGARVRIIVDDWILPAP
ncbi:MAG: outer membrane lipoprotein LolB [Proteobacteria bacterium]|nr:outer membrane lipoprotein LolB [Pseudomonadota bacterium]